MNATIINAVRNAALFAADKYRKSHDVLIRFNDARAAGMKESESEHRRIAATSADVATFDAADKALVVVALNAVADDMNRKVQMLSDKYQTEAASLTMTRVREVYEALAYVTRGADAAAQAAAIAGNSDEE